MSIRLMSSIWEHSKHSGTDLLMLLALADHANDDGVCWPSLPRLAARCRVSKRQAINIIHRLEKAGDITIARGGGRHHCSHYTVKGETECTVSHKGEIQRGNGEIQRQNGEIALSPEPPIEPPIEPKKAKTAFRAAGVKKEPQDETPAWTTPPVSLPLTPTDRPDDHLRQFPVDPETFARLYTTALARLVARGTRRDYCIQPVIHTEIVALYEEEQTYGQQSVHGRRQSPHRLPGGSMPT